MNSPTPDISDIANPFDSVQTSIHEMKAYMKHTQKQIDWLRTQIRSIPEELSRKILFIRVVSSDRNPALTELFWMRACENGVEFVPVSDPSQNMAYAMSVDEPEQANEIVKQWNAGNPSKPIVAMTFLQLGLTRANLLEKLLGVCQEFIKKNT